jgi:phosphoglucosamine mutase
MSNAGLHRALRRIGVGVVTVPVGDRHVAEALKRERLPVGGEQSGHVIFGAENAWIGDGLFTALRVLRILSGSGRPLSELAGAYRAFPQVLLNVAVARKPEWSSVPEVLASVQAAEAALGEEGRVLLRYSGTEPLARVMVEGPDASRIAALAEGIAQRIRATIGA